MAALLIIVALAAATLGALVMWALCRISALADRDAPKVGGTD